MKYKVLVMSPKRGNKTRKANRKCVVVVVTGLGIFDRIIRDVLTEDVTFE